MSLKSKLYVFLYPAFEVRSSSYCKKRNIQVQRAFSCSKSEISNTAVDLKLWSVDHQRPGECLQKSWLIR